MRGKIKTGTILDGSKKIVCHHCSREDCHIGGSNSGFILFNSENDFGWQVWKAQRLIKSTYKYIIPNVDKRRFGEKCV